MWGATGKRYVAEGAVVAGRGLIEVSAARGAGCLTECQGWEGADRSGPWAGVGAGVEPLRVGDVTADHAWSARAASRTAGGSQQDLQIREFAPKR
ncbi:hypothetical protein AQI96_03990 [Streptomyces canus]|nr:hypothetical protein AQI96_03990 [Streptomyces canus]